jgi:hypothetical protein
MSKKNDFISKHNLSEENVFELILGESNNVLPGKTWQSYFVVPGEESMLCYNAGDDSVVIDLPYSSFEKAEFGIGSGNLWLQCLVSGEFLPFCSTKKNWTSAAAKKILEKLDTLISEEDKKLFAKATGKFSFLYLMLKS